MTASQKKIHAPYNFVPLSGWIYQPEWANQVSRDMPFSDGINGEIKIRITAHSPILVGGAQQKGNEGKPSEVYPYKTVDGQYAISGATQKGAIRALMSIVSFGKMRQVDDQWLSIRDLTSGVADIYRRRMTTKNLKPRAKAGYLRLNKTKDGFSWEIVPCSFLRVEHDALIKMAQGKIGQRDTIKKRQSAPEKYEKWENHLDVTFSTRAFNPKDQSNKTTKDHEKAHDLNKTGNSKSGRLVFTGQPQENLGGSKTKHLEFVFFDENETQPIAVDPEVMRAFLHIHEEKPEWQYHIKRMNKQIGVPVFYLVNEKGDRVSPKAIGLALMFRLAYEHSIGQAVDHTNPLHREEKPHDLAEVLFGHINQNDTGMAGRVSFSTARLLGKPDKEKPFTTILNAPKASYFPNYICQDPDENGLLKWEEPEKQKQGKDGKNDDDGTLQTYMTLMDKDCKIRGWKRYPARTNVHLPQHPKFDDSRPKHLSQVYASRQNSQEEKDNPKVHNTLHPLAAGSTFEGSIRLHNVRPIELGALLWCLTWGGDTNLRHGMGMGKPLGMGQVSIEVDSEWTKLTINHGGEVPNAANCMRQFETLMEEQYRLARKGGKSDQGWRDSEQMVQLLAMANPHQKSPGPLKHMRLDKYTNEFSDAKGPKIKDPKHALVPYVPFKGEPDQQLFPCEPKPQDPPSATVRKPNPQKRSLQAEREAAAEDARKQKRLQHLPELTRKVLLELEVEGEGRAKHWLAEMEARAPKEAAEIADSLKQYYQENSKWEATKKNKLSTKQQEKIATIKKVLAAAGDEYGSE